MTEKEFLAATNSWKVYDVAVSLHASLATCDDVVRGRGYRFTFPGEAHVTPTLLEFYPERLIARYRSPLFELDLAHVRLVEPFTDKIKINAGDDRTQATIFVEARGALMFVVTPDKNKSQEETTTEPMPIPVDQTTVSSNEMGEPPEEVSQPRVNLVGRVGAQPNFRTTPKGVVIARFPLAVREAEDKTSWHTVLAFGPRAVKLEGAIKKGDAVEVIGYKHVREFIRRDGSKKSVEEIYAVVVKNR